MQAEVLAVGSELLLGQIVDTNSAVIARQLAAIGLDLYYKTTVGDNLSRVAAALRQALGRSQVVLTTGGIGPTADDITREAVAAATDRELVFSDHLMAQIEAYFAARGGQVSPSNRRQAFIPAGAIAVENPVGTAPAFIVEVGDRCVITLPGVYSVIVPPPSVVVVVVDVLDVCAHANGATTASAMLSIVFFTANPFPLWIPLVRSPGDSSSSEKAASAFY